MFENLFDLRGRTALVTGGATGLGRICAETLLKAGGRVLIASRKASQCEVVAAELRALGACEGFGGDVGNEAGVAALVDQVRARTDQLHILVNNAGATWGADFEEFGWQAWDKVLSVNVMGVFELTRHLMPMLIASSIEGEPSRIVNVGSMVGTLPLADRAYSYATSKAAVHHLTRILANEFTPRGVNVNAIAPGPFTTKMTAYALGDAHGAGEAASTVPAGRLGRPDDMAAALLYLCGRGGSFVSGAILPVDGGMTSQTRQHMFRNDDA
ncbi:NAD(P)-dependent dehydrogenase (short-subunit alcohol dehydrogenase family) [Microvirga lupini]|uniref:NAD(P)-dependent dehydrogenase (Short-subunit alcohol dehydrogenase family) n=2 Tax=Microvirga lupini TaxID=420324 RepID=A0A7W4VJ20_9HYPH|nr:NAD(P)-dependent dehydrogenase (short-subunit alcohol dehydrogenase family) [Microvirga lupini]